MKCITIAPGCNTTIQLGYRGENNARQIVFDCSGFEREYPGGTAQLLVQRHGDSVPYLPPVVRDGDTVIWTLSAADTAKTGTGRAELRWYVGEVLAKSRIWDTYTMPALGEPTEDVPEADKSAAELLIEQAGTVIQQAGAEADRAAESAQSAAVSASAAEASAGSAEEDATAAAQSAQAAAESAAAAAQNAQAAENSAAAAAQNAQAAAESAAAATQNAQAAENSATAAGQSAQRAAEQRQEADAAADRAATQADRAEQAAAQAGYLDFEIDQRGHLIYTRTDNVTADFSIEGGRLIYHGN